MLTEKMKRHVVIVALHVGNDVWKTLSKSMSNYTPHFSALRLVVPEIWSTGVYLHARNKRWNMHCYLIFNHTPDLVTIAWVISQLKLSDLFRHSSSDIHAIYTCLADQTKSEIRLKSIFIEMIYPSVETALEANAQLLSYKILKSVPCPACRPFILRFVRH